LVFGLSTLQREILFIGSSILGKLGTRSVLCDEKPKSGSSFVSYQDAILILRRLRVIIRENVYPVLCDIGAFRRRSYVIPLDGFGPKWLPTFHAVTGKKASPDLRHRAFRKCLVPAARLRLPPLTSSSTPVAKLESSARNNTAERGLNLERGSQIALIQSRIKPLLPTRSHQLHRVLLLTSDRDENGRTG
jgi:hypothetical protein